MLAAGLVTILLGVALAIRALLPTPAARPASFAIGDDVPTSFGIVAVEFIRGVDGLSHRALSGATHGVSGYVDAGHQQIQVAVALTNESHTPVSYTVGQFRLLLDVAGKSSELAATSGDLPNGRILPAAGIEGHLDFTLPAKTLSAKLRFHDPGRSRPVLIDLGTLSAPGAQQPSHTHH